MVSFALASNCSIPSAVSTKTTIFCSSFFWVILNISINVIFVSCAASTITRSAPFSLLIELPKPSRFSFVPVILATLFAFLPSIRCSSLMASVAYSMPLSVPGADTYSKPCTIPESRFSWTFSFIPAFSSLLKLQITSSTSLSQ